MITEEQFFKATGYLPEKDDLDRCNCDLAGQIMHTQCGWSKRFNKPMFMLTSYQREQSRLNSEKPRIQWSGKYQCYFTISSDDLAATVITNQLNALRALDNCGLLK